MEAKSRLILAALMSSVMVAMVTFIVTVLDLGLRSGFLLKWLKAYLIAWPGGGDHSVLHHVAGAAPDGADRCPARRTALTCACAFSQAATAQ